MLMILKPIVLIVMLLSFNSLVFAQSPSPLGLWLVEEGDALIEIYACGSFLCGKIACVKEPFEADGSVKLDKHNPKPHLRKRPILGLEMLSNFKTTNDANFWEEGKIYDPE
ncbi:MAG: DUF2147 domain-containing protein, partial [Gammaproteobacteria bacterium]|nr:DUF2147 domain-containing protein [Gammaproteobacteria bacterium]